MRTWASVDLPDPLGPITAWTSPERTDRSRPRRISLPATPARRPSISSTCVSLIGQHHHDHPVVHPHVVDRHGPGGRQRDRLARGEVELAAVLPALDGALVGVDLALGQGHLLVRARVVARIDVVVEAHYGELVPAHVEVAGAARGERVAGAGRAVGRSGALPGIVAA